MISRVLSAELPEHIGERVTIAGWLHRRLERWTARLTGAANVRQVSMFPRDLHRLSP